MHQFDRNRQFAMPILKAYCNVCNLWLNSNGQLLAHQAGRGHTRRELVTLGFNYGTNIAVPPLNDQMRSLAQITANQENSSKLTLQSNIQNGTTQRDDNTGQMKACRTKGEEHFCDICVVQLTSKSQADMHYEGSKHKKALTVVNGKLEDVQYEGVKRISEDACDICNVPLSSKAVADAHYSGSKHEKKLKLSQSLGANPVSGFNTDRTQPASATTPSSLSQVVSNSSSVSLVPVPLGTVGLKQKGTMGSFLYCSFCGVGVNSRRQMDAHWQGLKHKNNVNGLLPQAKNNFPVRTTSVHGRHVNPGHIFSHYSSPNTQASYRTGQSMSYVPHQF